MIQATTAAGGSKIQNLYSATRSNWDNRMIVRQVTQLAENTHFKVERKDIRIQHVRGQQEVVLEVDYSRTEELPEGYAYVFQVAGRSFGQRRV